MDRSIVIERLDADPKLLLPFLEAARDDIGVECHDRAMFMEELWEAIKDDDQEVLVLVDDGKAVGFAVLLKVESAFKRLARMRHLYVLPTSRKYSLMLFRAAQDWARMKNCTDGILLKASKIMGDFGTAVALYGRLGAELVEETWLLGV